MIVEVMGHNAGWIALYAGMAGGGDIILIPEIKYSMKSVLAKINDRYSNNKPYTIVVVAEGVSIESLGGPVTRSTEIDALGREQLGSRGVGHFVSDRIAELTGFESRCTVLGYLQRGGSPTAVDRIWATRVGAAAADLVMAGRFGVMPTVRGGAVDYMAIGDAVREPHAVPEHLYRLAARFF